MMIIRDFKLSDINDVLRIEHQVFPDPYPVDIIVNLHDCGAGFLVAEISDHIVGYIIFWVREGVGHIIIIAVEKDFQNMHIGSQLIDKAISIYKRNKIYTVVLEVRKSNENAINIYKKKGFVIIDEEPNYYTDGESAIIMKCDISENN